MSDKDDAELSAYLEECTTINPDSIQDEYVRVPSDLAFWGRRYSQAIKRYGRAAHARKVLRARLQPLVRAKLRLEGAKITEALVETAIEINATYIDACEQEIEAEGYKAECFAHIDSIRAKKEMLISLGATLRQEREAEIAIRKRDNDDL